MPRVERLVTYGALLALVLLMFVFGLGMEYGIKAVSCVEERTPALSVEVTAARAGHVAEYRVLGCSFYAYEAPRAQA
jgi:hypothetical protein